MKVDKNGYAKCELCGASRPTAKMVAAETCSGCGAVSSMICRGGCVVHERWIPDDMPVAHKHSPVDERKVAEAYRERVLEAFREWDMRPGDTRTWHQVVMEVDLP